MVRSTVILLTSVGSLVAQGVLDVLDGRRATVHIIGCSSDPHAPDLSRCDEVHIVPPTESAAWAPDFLALAQQLKPALIIAGRDADVEAIALLGETVDEVARAFVGGRHEFAQVIGDKAASAAFSRLHGLPFVETVSTESTSVDADADRLVRDHGFPLIAKPGRGFGSRGVRVLLEPEDLAAALQVPGSVIQPFLDPPGELEPDHGPGFALFHEVPEDRWYAAQSLIGPAGESLGMLTFRARMVRGRVEELWTFENAELSTAALRFTEAAIGAGWIGPLNVQFKKDRLGGWQAIEINGRFTGGTSGRLHLGFDEVAIVVNAWTGRQVIGPAAYRPTDHVVRRFIDVPVRPI